MRIFGFTLFLLFSLGSCDSGHCDIQNIIFIGDWTATNASYSESISRVQAQNRRDVGFSSTNAESFVYNSIDVMEFQFLNEDTVEWVTPSNSLTINYALDRENSEINLRTGYTHHKIEVKDCDHFILSENNLALGYTSSWFFERKVKKKN